MWKTWAWAGPYVMAIFWVLVLGIVLSLVPLIKQPLFGSSNIVSQTVLLISECAGLLLAWLLVNRMTHEIPEDEQGLTFLRSILRPAAAFIVAFVLDYLLQRSELMAFHPMSRAGAHWIGALGMASVALWLTLVWVGRSAALIAFCEGLAQEPAVPTFDSPSIFHHARATPEPLTESSTSDETIPLRRAAPKRTLGRYRILKELGRGSMGVVYLGEDPTIHRSVAIKTMRLDQSDDADLMKEVKTRFFHEAESTGRLSHPNIVTIYDAGEEEDLGYIAMEFLEGATLKASCRKESLLPIKEAVSIVATVAEALDYAHRQGIVHRDIKPSNIMVTNEHAVKVTDFGIARITTSTNTQTTMIMGTPSYISPEQVKGEKVDGRADIFSLGVVLFELLTSEKPFQAETITSLLFKIAHEPPLLARTIRPDLPHSTDAIFDRALQKNAVHRYQHARELAHDLRACVELLHA